MIRSFLMPFKGNKRQRRKHRKSLHFFGIMFNLYIYLLPLLTTINCQKRTISQFCQFSTGLHHFKMHCTGLSSKRTFCSSPIGCRPIKINPLNNGVQTSSCSDPSPLHLRNTGVRGSRNRVQSILIK